MKLKISTTLLFCCVALNGCAKMTADKTNSTENKNVSSAKIEMNSASVVTSEKIADDLKNSETTNKQPRTVREFFELLPQKYFPLEGCEPATDKNCDKARREYVKSYLETEDTANGFWKSGCDGGQSCLTLALFKRADSSYVVAVHTTHEADEQNYFLEYKNAEWSDISTEIVPEFSDKNIYELPQKGTIVEVFKKKLIDPDWSERGAKIYDLKWENGKFSIKK